MRSRQERSVRLVMRGDWDVKRSCEATQLSKDVLRPQAKKSVGGLGCYFETFDGNSDACLNGECSRTRESICMHSPSLVAWERPFLVYRHHTARFHPRECGALVHKQCVPDRTLSGLDGLTICTRLHVLVGYAPLFRYLSCLTPALNKQERQERIHRCFEAVLGLGSCNMTRTDVSSLPCCIRFNDPCRKVRRSCLGLVHWGHSVPLIRMSRTGSFNSHPARPYT